MTDKTERDALLALDIAIEQACQSRVTLHLTRAKQIREALAEQPAGAVGKGPLPDGAVAWLDMGKGEASLHFNKSSDSNRASKKRAMELFEMVPPGYHALFLAPPAASVDVEGLRKLADLWRCGNPDKIPTSALEASDELLKLIDFAGGAKGEPECSRIKGEK